MTDQSLGHGGAILPLPIEPWMIGLLNPQSYDLGEWRVAMQEGEVANAVATI